MSDDMARAMHTTATRGTSLPYDRLHPGKQGHYQRCAQAVHTFLGAEGELQANAVGKALAAIEDWCRTCEEPSECAGCPHGCAILALGGNPRGIEVGDVGCRYACPDTPITDCSTCTVEPPPNAVGKAGEALATGIEWRECKHAGSTDVTDYDGDWRYCHRREIASVASPKDCKHCRVWEQTGGRSEGAST
jgi:hypothetical protein